MKTQEPKLKKEVKKEDIELEDVKKKLKKKALETDILKKIIDQSEPSDKITN